MPCDIGGEPAPNVTWYRDAELLGDIPAVRYTVLPNNSLHIRYVTWYRDAEPQGDIPAVRYTVLHNNSLHIRYVTWYRDAYKVRVRFFCD